MKTIPTAARQRPLPLCQMKMVCLFPLEKKPKPAPLTIIILMPDFAGLHDWRPSVLGTRRRQYRMSLVPGSALCLPHCPRIIKSKHCREQILRKVAWAQRRIEPLAERESHCSNYPHCFCSLETGHAKS